MGKQPLAMMAEINSLQRMDVGALHGKYGELVPDLAKCRKCEILRAEIAYRLQERFYGISVSEVTKPKLVANGTDRTPGNGLPLAGTRLAREWKGVTPRCRTMSSTPIFSVGCAAMYSLMRRDEDPRL